MQHALAVIEDLFEQGGLAGRADYLRSFSVCVSPSIGGLQCSIIKALTYRRCLKISQVECSVISFSDNVGPVYRSGRFR